MRRALLALAIATPLSAQPPTPAPTETPSVTVAPDSPRASLQAYVDLCRSGSYGEAAHYLELPPALGARGPELARRLKAVLDHQLWIDPEAASPESAGDTRDGLPAGIEQLGTIRGERGTREPVRLAHLGNRWAFSRATVGRVDAWYGDLPDSWLRDHLPAVLLRSGPRELLYWQWLALPLLVLAAWALGPLLGALTRKVLARVFARTQTPWDDRLLERLTRPLAVAWGLILLAGATAFLGLTVPARRFLGSILGALGAVTVFWALWRSVDIGSDFLKTRPWAQQSPSSKNLVSVAVKLFKVVVVIGGVVTALAALGYPVATLLAGLGIGGIAVAFGAQKTIENLFGSVALAVDQPFRVGDLVKVEDFTAEVESIGLRSTRFRTPERSLITIPNGKVAEMKLESLTARDRLRFSATLGLVYGTSEAQLQEVLSGVERVLRGHPKAAPDGVVATFKAIGANALEVEAAAWIATRDLAEFAAARQEILLGLLTVIEESGTKLALPPVPPPRPA